MSKLIKNSFIYSLVTILQKAIGFFLLPIYTKYLITSEYGIITVVNSIIGFLSIFYSLSLNGAISRFYYKYKNDSEKVRLFWGSCFSLVLIVSVSLTVIFLVFHQLIFPSILKDIPFSPYMLIGMISILFAPSFTIYMSALQAKQEGNKVGAINLISFILKLALTIVFVVIFKMESVGVLLAACIVNVIFFLYTLFAFIPEIKISLDRKSLKEALKYSLPLIPHSLAGWATTMIDKIYINNLLSTSLAGIYNIGFQFGNLINILTTAINKAFAPWFFEQFENGGKGIRNIIKTSRSLIFLYSYLALGLTLLSPEVIYFMVDDAYQSAWIVVGYISYSYVFSGVYYTCSSALFLGNTKRIAPITISSAAVNIILNYLLIPKYGISGAAFASMISFIYSSAIVMFIVIKSEGIRYKFIQMYMAVIISFSISLIIFIEGLNNTIIGILVKVLVLVFAGYALFLLDKQNITTILKKIVNKGKQKLSNFS